MAPKNPAVDYASYYVLGLEDASADFEKWEGGRRKTELDFDFDDLVKQFGADRARKNAGYLIAERAVDELLAKLERQLQRLHAFKKRHRDNFDEDGLDDEGIYQAHIEYQRAYREGLVCAVYVGILDAYSEDGDDEDEEEDEDEDGEGDDPRPNPTAVRDWYEAGKWDSGHTFDPDTLLTFDIDLGDYDVKDNGGHISPAKLEAAAAKAGATLKQNMLDDYEEEWLDQNRERVEAEGHSPTEAFRNWLDGFVAAAHPWIKKWIEEAALEED